MLRGSGCRGKRGGKGVRKEEIPCPLRNFGNHLYYYRYIFLNSLDLICKIAYDFDVQEICFLPIQIH
jgi:hypothetical protein